MCTYRTWFVVGFSDPSDTVDILEWSSHDASPGFTKIESYGSRRLLCGVCAKANLSLVYMCMYLPVLYKTPYIHTYVQSGQPPPLVVFCSLVAILYRDTPWRARATRLRDTVVYVLYIHTIRLATQGTGSYCLYSTFELNL